MCGLVSNLSYSRETRRAIPHESQNCVAPGTNRKPLYRRFIGEKTNRRKIRNRPNRHPNPECTPGKLPPKLPTTSQQSRHFKPHSVSSNKNLEDKGLLKGYTAILDPVKLGYDLTAILFLQIEAGYLKNLVSELSQMANIITVYEITGDFDVVAVVKLKDRESLNDLTKNLLVTPHIRKVVTNISFNVVKEDFKVEL